MRQQLAACAALMVLGSSQLSAAEEGSPPAADKGDCIKADWDAQKAKPAQDDSCFIEAPGMDPVEARIVLGGHEKNRPKLSFVLDEPCLQLSFPISMTMRGDMVNPFPVDADGNVYDHGPSISPQIRLGAKLTSGRYFKDVALTVEYEHDLLTGAVGGDAGTLGTDFPDDKGLDHELRKAYVRIVTRNAPTAATMAAGYQTSHWGLGLLANDGAHGWTPGSGFFSDPRSGDRVLRMQIGLIHKPLGMLAVMNADLLDQDFLSDDDILLEGDRAAQYSGALLFGVNQPNNAGMYVAYRKQKDTDGNFIDVLAIDVAGQLSVKLDNVDLKVQAEVAYLTGTTQLGASATFPEQTIQQLGAAVRATAGVGKVGGAFDFLFASGDQNPDDDAQNGFRVDPNYEMGLLLYRQVVAAQTARGGFRAADPGLVGVPALGVERIATRQSVANTVALFPRVWWRPTNGFDLYGGPLFAFAPVPNIDPFNSRIAGGVSRNALNGNAGKYLGTELDLGTRYRLNAGDIEGTLGIEGGALFPGNAFDGPNGQKMDVVYGGRAMLQIQI